MYITKRLTILGDSILWHYSQGIRIGAASYALFSEDASSRALRACMLHSDVTDSCPRLCALHPKQARKTKTKTATSEKENRYIKNQDK